MTKVYGVSVYKSKNVDEYYIEHEAIHPTFGCATSFGRLERLSKGEMETAGLGIIQNSIRNVPDRKKSEKSELESYDAKSLKIFERNHLLVSISVVDDHGESRLRLVSMKYISGKFQDTGKSLIIKLPCGQDAFMQMLNNAFEKCA
jgi:hypothetical protein